MIARSLSALKILLHSTFYQISPVKFGLLDSKNFGRPIEQAILIFGQLKKIDFVTTPVEEAS